MDKTHQFMRNMYEVRDASAAQRTAVAVLAGAWTLAAWWLLWGRGLETLGGWLGWSLKAGDPVRRFILAAALSIYYIRILFTESVFLRRGVSWSEALTIAAGLLFMDMLLAIAGGAHPSTMGVVGGIGVVLFVTGSWMNSYAEYARHVWKQRPENRARLYTLGLFRYVRHPNFLGDLISFSGLSLIAGAWVTAVIPLIMLAGFVFVNVPMLDSHLHEKYGADFDAYASRTRKLIPLVY